MSSSDSSEWILFENNDFLVVNKPPLLSTLEDRGTSDNVLRRIRDEFPDAQVCHRIDKETSGLLLCAKHAEAYGHAVQQFESRQVKKVYHAIVEGIVNVENRLVEEPMRTLGSGKVRIDPFRGKDAQTVFTTIETFKKHTLMRCEPITGRTHQIRVHLSHYGTPIVADTMYEGNPFYLSAIKSRYRPKGDLEERPLIRRFALHSFQISFQDLSGEEISVQAEYPKDFSILLKQLRKNS